jgi:hypothetical protein
LVIEEDCECNNECELKLNSNIVVNFIVIDIGISKDEFVEQLEVRELDITNIRLLDILD